MFRNFEHYRFEIVSDFVLRISDFRFGCGFAALEILHQTAGSGKQDLAASTCLR